jgi:hypothetical protein
MAEFQINRTSPMLKLVSCRGTLLGAFTMPSARYQDMLQSFCEVAQYSFSFADPARLRAWYGSGRSNGDWGALRICIISPSKFPEYPDAFEIYGVSLEDFEAIPGITFAPGAGYLRTMFALA